MSKSNLTTDAPKIGGYYWLEYWNDKFHYIPRVVFLVTSVPVDVSENPKLYICHNAGSPHEWLESVEDLMSRYPHVMWNRIKRPKRCGDSTKPSKKCRKVGILCEP